MRVRQAVFLLSSDPGSIFASIGKPYAGDPLRQVVEAADPASALLGAWSQLEPQGEPCSGQDLERVA